MVNSTGCVDELYDRVISQYLAMMNELLAQRSYDFEVSSSDVPKESGVYAIYDKKMRAVIYVGRTKNLRRRLLGDHRRGNVEGSRFRRALQQNLALKSESEISRYISESCNFKFLAVEEFEEMVRLEHFTTAIVAPLLNVQLKQ